MSEPDEPRLGRLDDPAFRLAAKARARAHAQRLADGVVPGPFRVGLAGTFTLDPLVPFLTDALLAAALPPQVTLAPYGQLFQACLEPALAFTDGPDAIVLLFRLEDLMADELMAAVAGDADALARAEAQLDDLGRAVASLRASFAGTIVAALPPFPEPPVLDLLDGAGPSDLFARLRRRWSQSLASLPGVRVLDLDALQRFFGASRARDARTAHLYRQPWREGFLALVGERLAATLAATRVAGRKCIALDCDGTLWGGVVGEDGPQGVAIGDDFPGSAYRDFQRLLVSWRRRGVLLALLSRNDEADVWSVSTRGPTCRSAAAISPPGGSTGSARPTTWGSSRGRSASARTRSSSSTTTRRRWRRCAPCGPRCSRCWCRTTPRRSSTTCCATACSRRRRRPPRTARGRRWRRPSRGASTRGAASRPRSSWRRSA